MSEYEVRLGRAAEMRQKALSLVALLETTPPGGIDRGVDRTDQPGGETTWRQPAQTSPEDEATGEVAENGEKRATSTSEPGPSCRSMTLY